jgi:phosphatidylserine/phosphatidylglycerophosphate/cardiolipin synthase-like enzyme
MGSVKIAYYVVVKGRGYWRPHPRMKAFGFQIIRCGADGPAAWQLAEEWNRKWQAVRRGKAPPLVDLSKLDRDQAEAARRYPPGSIGAAFQGYIRTPEWSARALSARMKVWWPAWHRIRDMWGDVNPNTITFDQMSRWRAALERRHGRGVAHKTFRIWRAFWTIMRGMKVAHGVDPSTGIRNRAPAARWQRWSEGEAVQLVKTAWRSGYQGLACIIAIAWDTQFSPVDVRTLAQRHRADDGRLYFDRITDGRAKTGRPAIGTLSRRTERLVLTYLVKLGVELHPDALLFRNRSGNRYRDDTLGDDFRSVREIAFPGDKRRLMDMRRSGTVEAVAGGAGPLDLAAKMANSIDRSNVLHKTYAPGEIAAVRNTDDARLKGRRKMRAVNENSAKVSTGQPGRVSTGKPSGD